MLEKIISQLNLSLADSSLMDLTQLFHTGHPLLTLAITVLIPLSVLIFIRELCCWFYKINKILRRINRLERQLKLLSERLAAVNSISPVASSPTPPPAATVISPPLLPKAGPLDVDFNKKDF